MMSTVGADQDIGEINLWKQKVFTLLKTQKTVSVQHQEVSVTFVFFSLNGQEVELLKSQLFRSNESHRSSVLFIEAQQEQMQQVYIHFKFIF